MTTGRTVGKSFKFQIEDSNAALRDIPVMTIGDVGINYDEVDVTALQDALKNALDGQGNFSLDFGGPFDNTAVATASGTGAAAALSGSHTVLSALNGAQTPRSFGVYIGIQGYWATGDPVFGAIDSVIVSKYTVNPANGTYSAHIVTAGNRTNDPAWGTAIVTASS